MLIIKRLIYKINIYIKLFFYGFKAGDVLVHSNSDKSIINGFKTYQTKEQSNVIRDLLRGIITEEVKHLRYSLYKISQAADLYTVDKCTAVKHTIEEKPWLDYSKGIIRQLNVLIDDKGYMFDDKPTYSINLKYKNFPMFDFSRLFKEVYVDLNKKNGFVLITTELISKTPGFSAGEKGASRELNKWITEYNKTVNDNQKTTLINNCPFLGNLLSICFETYKADGNVDGVSYELFDLKFSKVAFNITTNDAKYFSNKNEKMPNICMATFSYGDIAVKNDRIEYVDDIMEENYREHKRRANSIGRVYSDINMFADTNKKLKDK